MANLSSLSKALKFYYESAYRTSGNLSESMSNKIDMNCLELNDADINPYDVCPLCNFLKSKEVLSIIVRVQDTKDSAKSFPNKIAFYSGNSGRRDSNFKVKPSS